MILFRAVKWILAASKWGVRNTIRLSMKGLERGSDIARYSMYRHLSEVVGNLHHSGKILSISESEKLCELFDLKNSEIVEANYPDHSILSLPFPDNEFDAVVSDQVLEHVEGNPQTAIDESFRVLKPGGLAVHTTCLINPIHNFPGDFWRFTPDGLSLLCSKFSKIIDVDGWGNPYVWVAVWLGLMMDGVPEASWHPYHKLAIRSREDSPISTWIVAQK